MIRRINSYFPYLSIFGSRFLSLLTCANKRLLNRQGYFFISLACLVIPVLSALIQVESTEVMTLHKNKTFLTPKRPLNQLGGTRLGFPTKRDFNFFPFWTDPQIVTFHFQQDAHFVNIRCQTTEHSTSSKRERAQH